MALREGIIEVLDKAQTSTAHHTKLLKTLRSLFDGTEQADEFVEALVDPLRAALVIVRKEAAVERVLDFVAKFAASVAPLETAEEEEEGVTRDVKEEEKESEGERRGGGEDRESKNGYTESEEEEELEPNFFNLLMVKMLSFHRASSRAVRYRSCQLVAKMINCAVERGCQLQSLLLEAVRDVMLERVRDKAPLVRTHAVQALELLQDDVSLQEVLVDLLERDPSPDVRTVVLKTIATSDHTFAAIIKRTRDVKEQIRKQAFLMLAKNCSIRNFRIEQRIRLLSDGLNDRSEGVRDACVKGLLHSWSRTLDGDILALLSKLDVESSPDVAEQALGELLVDIEVEVIVRGTLGLMDPANRLENWDQEEDEERFYMPVTEKVVPYDLLNSEESFYWACVCRYLHKMGDAGQEHMEKILPTLSNFCIYVQHYVKKELLTAEGVEEKVRKLFVCKQLLSIFSVMDLSDEVGRQRLGKMVLYVLGLPGLPLGLVPSLLSQQSLLWPQPQARVEKLLEVISDLQQPLLSTTLSTTQLATQTAPHTTSSTTLVSEDSQLAGLANLSLVDIHTDPDTLAKCLMIAHEMLKELRLKRLPINLKTMVDVLVLPSIQSEMPDIRELAFGCLGLACLHDISLARNHLLLFLQVSQVDHESVQAIAVKAVFDLLLLFGFEAFCLTCPGSSSKKTPKTLSQADETMVAGDGDVEETTEVVRGSEGEMGESSEDEEEKETDKITQRILTIMANFIDGESLVLREIAGEGMAKLLLHGRVISQNLLARLLTLWADPSVEEEPRLRAILGMFFPAFAASDRSCREMLAEVLKPVLETVSEAPADSPLRSVDLNKLTDYLLHLSAPQEPNEDSVHDTLALTVANAVLSEPENSVLTRVYCRALTRMELTSSNKAELLVLMDQIQRDVRDKRSLQHVKKAVQALKESRGDTDQGTGEKVAGTELENEEVAAVEEEEEEVDEEVELEEMSKAGANEGGHRPDRDSTGEVEKTCDDDDTIVPATPSPAVSSTQPQTPAVSSAQPHSPAVSSAQPQTPAVSSAQPQIPAMDKTPATKSTAKRQRGKRATRESAKVLSKTAGNERKKRKKKITFLDSSSGESSTYSDDGHEESTQIVSALPSRVGFSRAAKTSAQKRISKFGVVTPRGGKEGEGTEDSDDSLIGEHSPFIRQPAKSQRGCGSGIPMLNYDDDD